jgi:rod shape-determining protein MreB
MGNLVVDVGGGTSEVALVSLGGIVTNTALRLGGFDLDSAIQGYVRREYAIAIGERTAERIKIAVASAFPRAREEKAEIRGRDLPSGLPKNVVITSEEIREAIADHVRAIVASVIECIGSSPPDLVQDVLVNGVTLTGGGGRGSGPSHRPATRGRRPRRRQVPGGVRHGEVGVPGRSSLTTTAPGALVFVSA